MINRFYAEALFTTAVSTSSSSLSRLEARSRELGLRGDGDHVLVQLGQGAQRLARVDVEVVVLVHEARVPEQRHRPRCWPPGADAAAHPTRHVMTVLHVTSCHVMPTLHVLSCNAEPKVPHVM